MEQQNEPKTLPDSIALCNNCLSLNTTQPPTCQQGFSIQQTSDPWIFIDFPFTHRLDNQECPGFKHEEDTPSDGVRITITRGQLVWTNHSCSYCGRKIEEVPLRFQREWSSLTTRDGQSKIRCPLCRHGNPLQIYFPSEAIVTILRFHQKQQQLLKWWLSLTSHPYYGNGWILQTNQPDTVFELLKEELNLTEVPDCGFAQETDQGEKHFYLIVRPGFKTTPLKIRHATL